MRFKWENIIPLVVIIILIVLLVKLPPFLHELSGNCRSSYVRSDDSVVRILSLGLICITIVAVFKIISNNRK